LGGELQQQAVCTREPVLVQYVCEVSAKFAECVWTPGNLRLDELLKPIFRGQLTAARGRGGEVSSDVLDFQPADAVLLPSHPIGVRERQVSVGVVTGGVDLQPDALGSGLVQSAGGVIKRP